MKSKKTTKVILYSVLVFVLALAVYAFAGQKMSFEEAIQKKNRTVVKKQKNHIQNASIKAMSREERQKQYIQTLRRKAEQTANGNYAYLKQKYELGTLHMFDAETIMQLGFARSMKSVSLLCNMLTTYHGAEIRIASAKALGSIGDLKAIPVLIEALAHEDYLTRVAAAGALVKLGKSDEAFAVLAEVAQKQNVEKWKIDVEDRVEQYSGKIKEQKREEYASSFRNASLPRKAITHLGKIGSEQALDAVEPALYDVDEFVRLRAGGVLMESERKGKAIPVLEAIVSNPMITKSVRSAALSAIASGKGKKERAILEKYKKSSNRYLSGKAEKLIKKIAGK
ncbi:HEAT repeat domain-containing protein [bacterium]|nr:HEAT repeat domain-containing protein [bacterium]